jgi:hypothetical protein
MTITITAFERSPDGGKGLARPCWGTVRTPSDRLELRSRRVIPADNCYDQTANGFSFVRRGNGHRRTSPG